MTDMRKRDKKRKKKKNFKKYFPDNPQLINIVINFPQVP
jgi:hypothetical protein